MKPSLQVRLSQHLALTPQLQQSIRLLQLSTLELQQEVEQMLEQNPFLETDEEAVPAFEQSLERPSASATAAAERDDAEASGGAAGDEPAGVDAAEFGTTERDDWENGTERDDFDGIRELPSNSGVGRRCRRRLRPAGAQCRGPDAAGPSARPTRRHAARRRGSRGAECADRVARRGRLPRRQPGRDRRATGRRAKTAARRCASACNVR